MEVVSAGSSIVSYVFYGSSNLVLSFDAYMAVDCDPSVGLANQVFAGSIS